MPSQSSRSCWPWTALNVILFVFSLSVLGHSIYLKHVWTLDKHSLLKKTSYFSPVLKQLNIATFVKQADGALFESDHPSPWRNARKLDPAVEAAWEEFDSIRTFRITADGVRKLGKDPELAVKFPEEYGLGPEAYVAQLISFTKYTTLMCQGSLDVLTFNWMETQDWPFPDFDVNHQCRDFDSIVELQEDYALPLMMGRNLTRPEGAKQIPAPDAYYELFPNETVKIHDRRWELGG